MPRPHSADVTTVAVLSLALATAGLPFPIALGYPLLSPFLGVGAILASGAGLLFAHVEGLDRRFALASFACAAIGLALVLFLAPLVGR